MKTQNKILLLIAFMLVVLSANSQIFKGKAQKEKPVRYNVIEGDKYRGWFFYDGKYIDAPYKVKRKGTAIYINDLKVYQYKDENSTDPFEKNGRVGYPPSLTDSSSLDIFFKTPNDDLGISYYTANQNYFYKHYEYEIAFDSMLNYIRNAPNILSFKQIGADKYSFYLEAKNGDSRNMFLDLGSKMRKKSDMWGPKGKGYEVPKELLLELDDVVKSFQNSFDENNSLRIFFSYLPNGSNTKIANDDIKTILSLGEIAADDYSDSEKIEILGKHFRKDELLKKFVKGFQISKQFLNRYELLKKQLKKEEERKNNYRYNSIQKKTDTVFYGNKNVIDESKSFTVNSTPYRNSIYAWCGNIWEDGMTATTNELKDNIIIHYRLSAIEQYGNGYPNVNFSMGVRYTFNKQQK